eukprot:4421004-Prymnesium_polylepis.1
MLHIQAADLDELAVVAPVVRQKLRDEGEWVPRVDGERGSRPKEVRVAHAVRIVVATVLVAPAFVPLALHPIGTGARLVAALRLAIGRWVAARVATRRPEIADRVAAVRRRVRAAA